MGRRSDLREELRHEDLQTLVAVDRQPARVLRPPSQRDADTLDTAVAEEVGERSRGGLARLAANAVAVQLLAAAAAQARDRLAPRAMVKDCKLAAWIAAYVTHCHRAGEPIHEVAPDVVNLTLAARADHPQAAVASLGT
ncbi:hypothetical protein OV090_21905 [Nannocystis sp. RBIL2]|uniref:hypothetical protein n=1 Tax=Nannocystis sp. RBIL2 TaxID=2996788 RepID=UPI002270F7CC|nr:hypothetical protein [Nannocystis sp. RBIL2]MCY1067417.1 hypothetical protein [Nannocystis sp. RBIL2]